MASTLFAVIAAVPAFGALAWEHTTLEIDAGPLDEKIEAIFRFTNSGASPVRIVQTHASCGCTVPTLAKQTFAPGEAGDMRVIYTIGEGTVGKQEKTITLQTDEAREGTYLLTLSVVVPGLWEVQPKFVRWEHGEEPVGKTVRIRALYPELAAPVAVKAQSARFAAELQASADERDVFVVTIKPESTATEIFSSITVETSAPGEKKRVVQLYAVVR